MAKAIHSDYPNLLHDLLTGKCKNSKSFRSHIRSYNSGLAFASVGTKIIQDKGKRPYIFKIQNPNLPPTWETWVSSMVCVMAHD